MKNNTIYPLASIKRLYNVPVAGAGIICSWPIKDMYVNVMFLFEIHVIVGFIKFQAAFLFILEVIFLYIDRFI